MKKIILLISILLLFYNYSSAHVTHYKNLNYLEYELFRNDQLIGYHKYNFELYSLSSPFAKGDGKIKTLDALYIKN